MIERIQIIREPCPAKPGDYFEFFAEIDLLCALSTCPGGGKISFPIIYIPIDCTSLVLLYFLVVSTLKPYPVLLALEYK